ncbi:hypothetical protein HZS_7832 [Henneguya salminicola]|nr:hypothetical protein HZS_7832 [Henneguya salminicola]
MRVTYILIYMFYLCQEDELFDYWSSFVITKKVQYTFYGYKSFSNSGPFSGCCSNLNKGSCSPCRYMICIKRVRIDFFSNINLI